MFQVLFFIFVLFLCTCRGSPVVGSLLPILEYPRSIRSAGGIHTKTRPHQRIRVAPLGQGYIPDPTYTPPPPPSRHTARYLVSSLVTLSHALIYKRVALCIKLFLILWSICIIFILIANLNVSSIVTSPPSMQSISP